MRGRGCPSTHFSHVTLPIFVMSKSTNDAVRFSNSEFRAFIITFCCRLNLTEARLVTMASLVLLQANLLFSKEFLPVTIAELPQYFAESKGKYLKVRSHADSTRLIMNSGWNLDWNCAVPVCSFPDN